MRVFEYATGGSPRTWGQSHGEAFRGPVAELAEIRTELTMEIAGHRSRRALLSLASQHLPVLERFDRRLFEELLGIAEGANLDAASVVVLNHYTDLRDIAAPGWKDGTEEGCSVVYSRGDRGRLLGQTWDMHGSAEPYVLMIGVPESEAGPGGWFFSLTGCLGMTGLGRSGVAISINNLRSRDAGVGVVWSALVRRAVRESSHVEAARIIEKGPLGSGHHYFIASRNGAIGLETSGTACRTVFSDDGSGSSAVFVHTNHCLDPEIGAKSDVPTGSTTFDRYQHLVDLEEGGGVDGPGLWDRLGSHEGYPRSVCTHMASPSAPHASKTCGGLVMDLERGRLAAAQGCLHLNRPLELSFSSSR